MKIVEKDGLITHVELKSGEIIEGKNFISNIHPATTMHILESTKIKKAYSNRLQGLENSVSAFIITLFLNQRHLNTLTIITIISNETMYGQTLMLQEINGQMVTVYLYRNHQNRMNMQIA